MNTHLSFEGFFFFLFFYCSFSFSSFGSVSRQDAVPSHVTAPPSPLSLSVSSFSRSRHVSYWTPLIPRVIQLQSSARRLAERSHFSFRLVSTTIYYLFSLFRVVRKSELPITGSFGSSEPFSMTLSRLVVRSVNKLEREKLIVRIE